jgi:oligoribonuclease (3'-5' exoribonuclease)
MHGSYTLRDKKCFYDYRGKQDAAAVNLYCHICDYVLISSILNTGNSVKSFTNFSYNGIPEFTNAFNFTLNDISWLKQNINKFTVEMCSPNESKRKLTNISCSEMKRVDF